MTDESKRKIDPAFEQQLRVGRVVYEGGKQLARKQALKTLRDTIGPERWQQLVQAAENHGFVDPEQVVEQAAQDYLKPETMADALELKLSKAAQLRQSPLEDR